MGAWVSVIRACAVLSPRVPFYRPRGGTRLHRDRANMDHGVGEHAGQLEASVSAWFDGLCSGVLGDDGACVSSHEILCNT